MPDIQFEPISSKLGATVKVSPDDLLKDGNPEKIWEALNKYMVLLFPQINLSDDQQIALTGALGDMEPAVVTADGSAPAGQGIYRIALDKNDQTQKEYVLGNNFWHIDGTVYSVPGKGTLLKCVNPPNEGGETEFANLFAAYEALPEEKKQQIENLRVVHCLEAVGRQLYENPTPDDLARWEAVFPHTEHPLVWHQKDGRTSIVIGSTAFDIVGMPHEEGYALLQELLEWSEQDQFTYSHKWQKGDLVIFNNPGLLHRSCPYNETSGRLMHRTTLKGYEEIA